MQGAPAPTPGRAVAGGGLGHGGSRCVVTQVGDVGGARAPASCGRAWLCHLPQRAGEASQADLLLWGPAMCRWTWVSGGETEEAHPEPPGSLPPALSGCLAGR